MCGYYIANHRDSTTNSRIPPAPVGWACWDRPQTAPPLAAGWARHTSPHRTRTCRALSAAPAGSRVPRHRGRHWRPVSPCATTQPERAPDLPPDDGRVRPHPLSLFIGHRQLPPTNSVLFIHLPCSLTIRKCPQHLKPTPIGDAAGDLPLNNLGYCNTTPLKKLAY